MKQHLERRLQLHLQHSVCSASGPDQAPQWSLQCSAQQLHALSLQYRHLCRSALAQVTLDPRPRSSQQAEGRLRCWPGLPAVAALPGCPVLP